MNCRQIIAELSNYIDGELDASLRQEIESHLHGCKECEVVVNQTRLTVDIFCDAQLVELPQDVRERLHQTLQKKMHTARP